MTDAEKSMTETTIAMIASHIYTALLVKNDSRNLTQVQLETLAESAAVQAVAVHRAAIAEVYK